MILFDAISRRNLFLHHRRNFYQPLQSQTYRFLPLLFLLRDSIVWHTDFNNLYHRKEYDATN